MAKSSGLSLLPKAALRPAIAQFVAVSNLSVTFKIINPSTIERNYLIYLGLFDKSGSAIDTWMLPEEMAVAAGSSRQVPAAMKIDYSNCFLQASLYNVQTGGMSSALQVTLDPPPGLSEQIEPVVGFASGIMMLGIVVGMVTGMTPI